MNAAIELDAVGKRFGTGVVALEDISLVVEPGEFVSLIGPSGCGKTTLLRLIAGLESASGGTVRVRGHTPEAACREHEIGVAFQRPALVPSRTARANIALTLEITGGESALDPDQLLAEFGLAEFSQRYPHELSGGMQQRVNIACALVHRPAVLLLDEPFGALDEMTREAMASWLAGVLAQSRQTVILVTHSVVEAVTLSDRIVVLSPRPGRVAAVLENPLPRPRDNPLEAAFVREESRVRKALRNLPTDREAAHA